MLSGPLFSCSKHFVGTVRVLVSPSADSSIILGQTHSIFNQVSRYICIIDQVHDSHILQFDAGSSRKFGKILVQENSF